MNSADKRLDLVGTILQGREQVVSHPGTSQYGTGTGLAACGLAALNCARVILGREQDGVRDEALLRDIVSPETAQEITSICALWSSHLHLEVDDICRVPFFDSELRLISNKYDRPGTEQFKALLLELQSMKTSAAVIITRPPEIFACLKLVISNTPVFIIFDSHPRPSYPDGAGFVFNTSLDVTARRLNKLLAVDSRLLADTKMQWQAQLLSHYSGHIFVSKKSEIGEEDMSHAVLHSSLAVLTLQAQVSDLKFQNSSLTAENKRLYNINDRLEEKCQRQAAELSQAVALHNFASSPKKTKSPSTRHTNAVAGSSRSGHGTPSQSKPKPSARHADINQAPAQRQRTESHTTFSDFSSSSFREPPDKDGISEAYRLQLQFNEEDARLQAELQILATMAQSIFKCGVCLDEHPEDYVARVDECGHRFCRECIQGYIGSKLKDHRFPILCPVCTAEKGVREPSVITNALAQQVGISEKQNEIWTELEMVAFSTLLHCRKCQRSAFVDRQELQETDILACPLPKCNHLWCKSCQREVPIGGPKHSCDGSSELDHLMKNQGWKYCPGCKTPIQKAAGCNHMTCISPGCNSHFCYICSELIIRSALGRDVQTALTNHYRRCQLFQVPT